MRILLLEPFFGGSHKQWAEGLARNSSHDIKLITLPDRHWKWRMHGAAITFAHRCHDEDVPDLILCTDMLDVAVFKSLCPSKFRHCPILLYFHENQLTYPWSPNDEDTDKGRDLHYAFINITSALAADRVCFNSNFHRKSFIEAIPAFLKSFPDYREEWLVNEIELKSEVLPLAIDLKSLGEEPQKNKNERPVILWNHRWEYDKNPELFFETLMELSLEGEQFDLVVLGESFLNSPPIFKRAQEVLRKHIKFWNFAENRAEYAKWLWLSDIAPVTSKQDFFGIGAVEAAYCNCDLLLPDKLAFPEIHGTNALYYNSDSEFKTDLRSLIRNENSMESIGRSHLSGYDWEEMIKKYDDLFQLHYVEDHLDELQNPPFK